MDAYNQLTWANDILRYAIEILKGGAMNARDKTRLAVVLDIKKQLDDSGFWWQSRTLNYWIHRFQRGDFTSRSDDTNMIGEDS